MFIPLVEIREMYGACDWWDYFIEIGKAIVTKKSFTHKDIHENGVKNYDFMMLHV